MRIDHQLTNKRHPLLDTAWKHPKRSFTTDYKANRCISLGQSRQYNILRLLKSCLHCDFPITAGIDRGYEALIRLSDNRGLRIPEFAEMVEINKKGRTNGHHHSKDNIVAFADQANECDNRFMKTTAIPEEELPFWIQRAMRGIDWGVLIVLALCLIASIPFLNYQGVPIGTAFERYIFRTADYAQALESGWLYPRWSAEALNGYGAPIPHYYAPAVGYLPAIIDIVTLNNPKISVIVSFIISLCLAGTCTYAFVARRCGATIGVVAAVLYIFNPLVGYTVPHQLGDLTLAFGVALLPMGLWALDRLLHHDHILDLRLTALAYGAAWLTDIRFAMMLTLYGFILIGAQFMTPTPTTPPIRWRRLFVAPLLGIMLAACYWLPAASEQDAVRWTPQTFSVPTSFAWQGLFAPIAISDPAAMLSPPSYTFGTALLFILGLSALALVTTSHSAGIRLQRGFFLGGVVTLALGIGLFTEQSWILIPLAFAAAIAGSSAVRLRERLPLSFFRVLPVALCAIAIGSVIPLWLTGQSSLLNVSNLDTDASARLNFQQRGYGVAILPSDSPVPTTISTDLEANGALIRSYSSGDFARTAPNSNLQLGVLAQTAHLMRLQVQTFDASTLNILTAYFPGWTARFGNRDLPLSPSPENGLIDVELPADEIGELVVSMTPTLPRWGGWGITWLGVISLLIIGIIGRRRADRSLEESPIVLLSRAESRLFFVLMLVVLLTIGSSLNPQLTEILTLRPASGSGLVGVNAFNSRSNSALAVIGYSAPDREFTSGDWVNIRLYFRTLQPVQENYLVEYFLHDPRTGEPTLLQSAHHPNNFPTTRWLPRRYAMDTIEARIPANLPSGDYEIFAQVFSCLDLCRTRQPLNFFNADGTPIGERLIIPDRFQIISF